MKNCIIIGDCLAVHKKIKSKSVDLILTDLPYGKTRNKWDNKIDFTELFGDWKRILTDSGTIILTSTEPFTSFLVNFNLEMFKYDLIWIKDGGAGWLNTKYQPIRSHESILVFSKAASTYSGNKKNMTYNPQLTKIEYKGDPDKLGKTEIKVGTKSTNYDHKNYNIVKTHSDSKYPKSIIYFPMQQLGFQRLNPTQKPLALFEYLINTYSNECDTVLDSTAGSLTTAHACQNTNRNFICIENDREQVKKSLIRLKQPFSVKKI